MQKNRNILCFFCFVEAGEAVRKACHCLYSVTILGTDYTDLHGFLIYLNL